MFFFLVVCVTYLSQLCFQGTSSCLHTSHSRLISQPNSPVLQVDPQPVLHTKSVSQFRVFVLQKKRASILKGTSVEAADEGSPNIRNLSPYFPVASALV